MCFWQAKLLQLAGELQVLSEDVFIQILTDIQGFNAEILPCAPCGCGSGGENTARDETVLYLLYYCTPSSSAGPQRGHWPKENLQNIH